MVVVKLEDLRAVCRDLFVEAFQISMKEEEERYLTVEQVCERLGVSRVTLYRWNQEGSLPCVKIGAKVRYKESDVRRLMEGRIRR